MLSFLLLSLSLLSPSLPLSSSLQSPSSALIENAVRAALGMPVVGLEQKPYDGYWAEIVLHSGKDGVYKRLWIEESVQECVIERDIWVRPGEKVKSFTAANFSIGTLVLRFESEAELQAVMAETDKYIKVILED